jgi:hypothetical protein
MTISTPSPSRPILEELHYRKDCVHVSLVVNRRHRTARVVDFLAGNFVQKQQSLHALAHKEGIERLYTLVEREESHGWMRAGYAREGSIPSYYRRSDAYLMGYLVVPTPELTEEGVPVAPVADVRRAERTLTSAKRLLAEVSETSRSVRSEVLTDENVVAARYSSARGKRPVWLDDRFGRGGNRLHVSARQARLGRGEQVISAEVHEPFGNAYVQPAAWPTKADEGKLLVAALGALNDHLRAREVACAFAVSPVDNAVTAAAMLSSGFRKTGLLARHILVGERKVDAILWTRKPTIVASADAA